MFRTIAGFLVVALAYPAYAWINGDLVSAFWVLWVTIPATLIGIALFALFRARRWFAWWQFALGGALLGVLGAIPFLPRGAVFLLPAFAAIGAAHGLLFWLVAIAGNSGLTSRSTRTPTRGPSAERWGRLTSSLGLFVCP
jgi:hypothetical protein